MLSRSKYTTKGPPELTDLKPYHEWRNQVNEWRENCNIEKQKQAAMLVYSLKGKV